MADVCGLDLYEILNAKVDQNAAKYPVEKARGSAAKYTELTQLFSGTHKFPRRILEDTMVNATFHPISSVV